MTGLMPIQVWKTFTLMGLNSSTHAEHSEDSQGRSDSSSRTVNASEKKDETQKSEGLDHLKGVGHTNSSCLQVHECAKYIWARTLATAHNGVRMDSLCKYVQETTHELSGLAAQLPDATHSHTRPLPQQLD
jgi:hypothetical protein